MQPVLPRTTVLGPAAFASSVMICADWQPWHVRWPDVKYSSCGTFLTPLKGSRFCVGFSSTKVLIVVILSGSRNVVWRRGFAPPGRGTGPSPQHLSSQPPPLRPGLRLHFGGFECDL